MNEATYVAAPIMIGGYAGDNKQPFKVDSVTITSMNTPAPAPPPMDPSKLMPKAVPAGTMFPVGAAH